MSELPLSASHSTDDLGEKIRSGEYFREARVNYHTFYTDPMVDRYFYFVVTVLSSVILAIIVSTIDNFLPLNSPVPFVYRVNDAVEDLPRTRKLASSGQDTNVALRQFLVAHYVRLRENYNVQTLDKNATGVRSHSTDEVFNAYQDLMDPRNALSPITLYQRNSTRRVEVLSATPVSSDPNEMEVQYDEIIEGAREVKRSRMQANITFRFNDITINRETGAFTPLEFTVTQYQTKKLQDL